MNEQLLERRNSLQDRWRDDPVFREAAEKLGRILEEQDERFTQRNRKILLKLYNHRTSPSSLDFADYPNVFRNTLDMTETVRDLIPVATQDCSGGQRLDMRGFPITHEIHFRGVLFRNVDFSFACAKAQNCAYQCQFYNCLFDYANLPQVSLDYYFRDCRFMSTDLAKADTSSACFEKCVFQDCKMPEIRIHGAFLVNSTFVGCDMRKMELGGAHVWDCEFQNCNFRNGYLDGGDFQRSRFVGCDFRNTFDGFVPPGVES